MSSVQARSSVVAWLRVTAANAVDTRAPAMATQAIDAVRDGQVRVHIALAVVVAVAMLVVSNKLQLRPVPSRWGGSGTTYS